MLQDFIKKLISNCYNGTKSELSINGLYEQKIQKNHNKNFLIRMNVKTFIEYHGFMPFESTRFYFYGENSVFDEVFERDKTWKQKKLNNWQF
ncbi:hypothetical protein BpHYR1_004335 [Brachionus plicatilis]|uniref:Uncharacterized protein n=1 Tax=Brachionus plicatilis TaxID=10195 RepID=A0A3M7SDX7_BRAPC|nr:hypothetical protein BpHYR1_004335 [Brachionus plicatilis]